MAKPAIQQGTWAIEPPVRRVLARTVLELRTALEDDFARQLRAIGIHGEGPQALPPGRKLTADEQHLHEVASAIINRETAGGASKAQAWETYVRDSAFTFLNRMVGLRCLEERDLLFVDGQTETVIKADPARNASSLYWRVRNELGPQTQPREVWRESLRRASAAISERVKVLFDPDSEYAALLPLQPALQQVIDALNSPTIPSSVYAEDELLGWIYQYYNASEKDAAYAQLAKGKKLEQPSELIAATCLYTERYMVDYLLQNTLGALWVEMYPESKLPEHWPYFVRPPEGEISERPVRPVREITVLDPACGSGHFLVRAFDLLVQMYREEGREAEPEIPHLIIERNLHGIDIDLRAVQIAALGLFLKGCALAGPSFTPGRLNLVAADVLLPQHEPSAEYVAKLQADPQAVAVMTGVWSGLRKVREFGALLHPERSLDEVVRRQRAADPLRLRDDKYWEQWKGELLNGLQEEFQHQAQNGDVGQRLFGRGVAQGLTLVGLLGRRYDVVVTNPPYVGSRNLGSELRSFIESEYPQGKRDLYAAFLIRAQEFCSGGSFFGVVTQHGWMFLDGFADLRASLLRTISFRTLCHLGTKTFKDLSNSNALGFCVFTASGAPPRDTNGVFFRLVRSANKQGALAEALRNHRVASYSRSNNVFAVNQKTFLAIPNSPLAYWAPRSILDLFEKNELMGSVSEAKQGLITGDNERFLRAFWETPFHGGLRWFPYMKGGPYRRWYGNTELVVDWTNEGESIRNFTDEKGKVKSRPQNVRFYGQVGATWTAQSSYGLSMRWMPAGSFFDAKGPALFPKRTEDLFGLVAVFNTNLLQFLFGLVQPTIDFHEGYLLSLPFPSNYQSTAQWKGICELGSVAVALKRRLAEQLMTEHGFQKVALEANGRSMLGVAYRQFEKQMAVLAAVHWIEGIVSDLTVDLYGLHADERDLLIDEEGLPSGWQPSLAGYEDPPDLIPPAAASWAASVPGRTVALSQSQLSILKARLIHLLATDDYDQLASQPGGEPASDTGEEDQVSAAPNGIIGLPVESSLETLSWHLGISPVSVYRLFGEVLQTENRLTIAFLRPWFEDYVSATILRSLAYRWPEENAREQVPILDPALVDEDGIIPFGPCGDHPTALDLVRTRLERDFGLEGANSSEEEFRQWVGRDLADWLRRDFFRRHAQQFKQRPIAWHLVSRDRTFETLVLYHKLSRATLQRLRGPQYAGGLITRLKAEQERARQRDDAPEVNRLQLQVEDVEEFWRAHRQDRARGRPEVPDPLPLEGRGPGRTARTLCPRH